MGARRRARDEESKQDRRAAILDAAGALFAESAYAAVGMQAVAERVGVVKGTLYLYFPTKEALFLALLQRQLTSWFDDVDGRLAALGPTDDAGPVAALFCASLASRPALIRLLALLHGVLEHNVGDDAVLAFKRFLLDRLARTGAAIERCRPPLTPGQGMRWLLRLHALVIGLGQITDPAPAARRALREPDLHPLIVDFGSELEDAARALLAGAERSGAANARGDRA